MIQICETTDPIFNKLVSISSSIYATKLNFPAKDGNRKQIFSTKWTTPDRGPPFFTPAWQCHNKSYDTFSDNLYASGDCKRSPNEGRYWLLRSAVLGGLDYSWRAAWEGQAYQKPAFLGDCHIARWMLGRYGNQMCLWAFSLLGCEHGLSVVKNTVNERSSGWDILRSSPIQHCAYLVM